MPFDLSEYNEFFAISKEVENPQELVLRVDPASNDGANILCIYTGTWIVGKLMTVGDEHTEYAGGSQEKWSRGHIRLVLPTGERTWVQRTEEDPDTGWSYYRQGTVMVSLASIYNANVANDAGWSVDAAIVGPNPGAGSGLAIIAKVAVRDTDAYLYRLAYQATILGKQTRAVADEEIYRG